MTWNRIACVLALVSLTSLVMMGCNGEPARTKGQPVKQAKVEPKPGPKVEPEPTKAISVLVLPDKDASPFLSEDNFVTKWLVLGPFTFTESDFGGDQQQAAVDKEFMPAEGALDGTQKAPKGTSWKEQQFKEGIQAGQCDLDGLYGGIEHAAAYAVAWVKCPKDLKGVKLYTGSDDYIKVWINGKLVHTYKTCLLYTSPSPRDLSTSRMPSSA